MKKTLLLALVAIFFSGLSAQVVAVQEKFELDKQDVSGYTMTFVDKSVDLVNNAFKSYLEKIHGLKSGKGANKGFSGYQKQVLQTLGPSALDIYYKVVEEGKKASKATRLYFVFRSFASASEIASVEVNTVKFLNDFSAYLIKYENQEKLKLAQNALEKLQKDHEGLKKDKSNLENDISKLQDKVKNKEKEIADKENEIKNGEAEVVKYQRLLGGQ
jgi:type III secretory pathway component EscR